ncbi:MAG: SEL1-like repeat protein [Chromatiales bacterium]|nr:SEL1-like repeat protein [Chromatiales bacterium]
MATHANAGAARCGDLWTGVWGESPPLVLLPVPEKADNQYRDYAEAVNLYRKGYHQLLRPQEFHDQHNPSQEKKKKRGWVVKLPRPYSDYGYFGLGIHNALLSLADQRYTPAFYCMGKVHEFGIGVPINYSEAWAWYHLAATVDGLEAKPLRDRVAKKLDWQSEMEAHRVYRVYLKRYTDFDETSSTTILH